jgi:hypothetical protein
MSKIKTTVIIAIACIAAIFGVYYEYHNQVSYTDKELKVLYQKYNITENDLKFARGELPNYLEGTIFQNNSRLLVTETGEPPEGLKEGVDYDMVMSEQEMSRIIKEAETAYIEKYGVDPANPKLDSYNGYLLPKEEVDRLMFLNLITLKE